MSKETTAEEKQIAEQIGAKLFAQDVVANVLGIKLDQIAPGYARMSMHVRNDMLNGLGICHGGMTFTLADTAFAYACNSRNEKTVALACTISFAQGVYEGDVLTAIAEEEILNGKTGIYNVVVTNRLGEKVALFRGNSYKTSQAVVPGLPSPKR